MVGFSFFLKKCLKLFNSSKIVLEGKPMENLIKSKNLMAYKHRGFWQPVDNIKDKKFVEKIERWFKLNLIFFYEKNSLC